MRTHKLKQLRWIAIFLACLWIVMTPAFAQERSDRFLSYGETVGAMFNRNITTHEWEFEGDERDIISIRLRRIGGVFEPGMLLLAPDGTSYEPSVEMSSEYGQELVINDGLPISGTYQIIVEEIDGRSDGVATISEYSLTLERRGQHLADRNEGLDPLPIIGEDFVIPGFVGTPNDNLIPDVNIYGRDFTFEPDAENSVTRFVLADEYSVELDNTTPLSRVLAAIALDDAGVTLQSLSNAMVFTDQNISNLMVNNFDLTIELENGQSITTDFYRVTTIIAVDDLVAFRMSNGQHMVFDGQNIRLTRHGGIAGEGAGIEPVSVLLVDGEEIQTDLADWDILTILDGSLRVLYQSGLRLISDVLSVDLFEQNNASTSPTEAASQIEITLNGGNRAVPLVIDPLGMGDVVVSGDALTLNPLDEAIELDLTLSDIRSVMVENRAIRTIYRDDTVSTLFPDNTLVRSGGITNTDNSALPNDEDFRPRNFNNLGTTVSDYHPRVDMDFALDPVNRVIGNFVYPVQDYLLPSHAIGLEWTRTYNSLAVDNLSPVYLHDANNSFGTIGNQWRHSYQIELDISHAPFGQVRLILADGSSHLFTAVDSSNTVFRSTNLHSWVIERETALTGTWRALNSDGFVYQFDRVGRLSQIELNGHAVTFSPIPRHYLAENDAEGGFFVTESYGRRIEVYTDADNRIILMRDIQGRRISYQYDGDNLIGVDYIGDYRANYDYTDGLLIEIDDVNSPYHQRMSLSYDASGRVTDFTFNPDGDVSESYALEYDVGRTLQRWTVAGDERRSSWQYDSEYRLTAWVLPNPTWVYRWQYNSETGRLTELTQPDRATFRFTYDRFGYLTTFTDPLFGAISGQYAFHYISPDGYVRLLQQIDVPQAPNWMSIRYDENHNIAEITRRRTTEDASVTSYSYDNFNRIAQIASPTSTGEALVTAYQYDDFGYVSHIVRGSRANIEANTDVQAWQFVHDFSGRLLNITENNGLETSLNWDTARNLITGLRAGDMVYSYAYDGFDNLIQYSAPDANDSYSYDGLNRLMSVTDAHEQTTTYEYDSVGNVVGVTFPDESHIAYEYDELDHLVRATNDAGIATTYGISLNTEVNRTVYRIGYPTGEMTTYLFDPLGRVRLVADFNREGAVVTTHTMIYTALGYLTEVEAVRGPASRRLTASYDLLGNPLTSTVNNLTTVTYNYDTVGNLIRVADPLERSTSYSYDILGNPVQVIQPDNTELNYAYDAAGNLVRFVDAMGNTTTYDYDEFHRLARVTDSEGFTTRYTYNAAGNLESLIDARDVTLFTNTYDETQNLSQVEDAVGNVTSYAYDPLDNLMSVTEANGLVTEFTYDAANHIVAITQPNDREFLYGRDGRGRITSVTNPIGQSTLYAYNTIGSIGRITDPLGDVQTFSWSGNGLLLRYAAPNGVAFEYIPDELGRLESIVNIGNNQQSAINTRIEYNELGEVTAIRFGNSNIINSADSILYQYSYDEMGRVTSYSPPTTDGIYEFEYDDNGDLIRVTDPSGLTTLYVYDARDNIIQVTEAAGTASEVESFYTYNEVGNVASSITPDGITRTYTYDSANRLTVLTETGSDSEERSYSFVYDPLGRLQTIFDPNGNQVAYRYDVFGNLSVIERPVEVGGETVTIAQRYQYNELDRLTQIQLAEGQTISMTYNALGQRVRYIDAENNSWSFSYDDGGNLNQVSNPLGYTQIFNYDNSNRLRNVTYGASGTVEFFYDLRGQLSAIVLPDNGNARERVGYTLNRLGQLLEIEHITDEFITFERDVMGVVQVLTTAEGEQIEFTYDEFNRILSINAPNFEQTRRYTSTGQIAQIFGTGGRVSYAYDGFGNVSQFQTSGAVFTYGYDLADNLLSRTGAQFEDVTYEYDEANRPVRINIGDEWVRIGYNANGWRTSVERSNGVRTTYTYTANGRVRNITHVNADGTRLDGYAYEYDAAGNVIRITRVDNWAILYSYDEARQLISERWLDASNQLIYSVNYTYDAVGNRIEKTERLGQGNPQRTLYSYDNDNQLVTETRDALFDIEQRFSLPVIFAMVLGMPLVWYVRRFPRTIPLIFVLVLIAIPSLQAQGPTVEYNYDADGNLIQESYSNFSEVEYRYDVFNRLIGIDGRVLDEETNILGNLAVEIEYNAMGQISRVVENGNNYHFDYDAYGLAAIRGSGAQEQAMYSASGRDVLLLDTPEGLYWTVDDGFGGAKRFTDNEGNLLNPSEGFHENAFGEIVVPYDDQLAYDLTLPEHELVEQIYLPESDIILYGVRAYSPRLGRFLQRDWVRHDPRGNLYTYVYNSPTNFTDETGLTTQAAFNGITPDIPDVDPMDFVRQPAVPTIPTITDVAQLQAIENQRVLELSQTLQAEINATAVAVAPHACDLYLPYLNPAPDFLDYDALEMLSVADARRDYLPISQPQIGHSNGALQHMATVAELLAFVNQSGGGIAGCTTPLSLPAQADIDVPARYDDLIAFREDLVPTALYPIITEQVPQLLSLPDETIITPELTLFDLQPEIVPSVSGQVENLRAQTADFFGNVLLPQVNTNPFVWQNLYQAQDVSEARGARIDD